MYFFNRNTAAAGGGAQSDMGEWQLSWVNRTGQVLQSVGPWGPYRGVDVSPDTTRVAVHRHDPKGGDIWILEPRGSETHLTFDASRHNSMPVWSPDGKQLVYASQQKGKWGLYRTGSGQWQVSEGGGDWPRWRRDGKEIFYHSIGITGSPSTNFGNGAFGGPLYSASVNATGVVFEPGEPRQLLLFPALNLAHSGGDYHNYAISPDGERFLVPRYVAATGAATGQLGADLLSGLTIAVNWTASLGR